MSKKQELNVPGDAIERLLEDSSELVAIHTHDDVHYLNPDITKVFHAAQAIIVMTDDNLLSPEDADIVEPVEVAVFALHSVSRLEFQVPKEAYDAMVKSSEEAATDDE